MGLTLTNKTSLEPSGDSLDDVIEALQAIRARARDGATVEIDSYELVVEWTENA